MTYFVIYKRDDRWHWRLISHEDVMAMSKPKGFDTKRNCKKAAETLVLRLVSMGQIPEIREG